MTGAYPHLARSEWTRGRLVRELQDADWWSVADEVADGGRLTEIVHNFKQVDANASAVRIIAEALAAGCPDTT